MFEKITVRRTLGMQGGMDVGTFAEVLLFYGSVHLVLDMGRLSALIKAIGTSNIQYLLNNDLLKVTYCRSMAGVISNQYGFLKNHDFGMFELSGEKRRYKNAELIEEVYKRAIDGERPNQREIKDFLKQAKFVKDFNQLVPAGETTGTIIAQSLQNHNETNYQIRKTLSLIVPTLEIPSHWYFRVHKEREGYVVETNFEYSKINKVLMDATQGGGITSETLLSHYWESHIDLVLAANYGSELFTSDISSALLNSKLMNLLQKVSREREKILEFNEFVFAPESSVAEALNTGQRTFDDFRPILEKSREFRKWISGMNPDKDLIREYHRECLRDTWATKLPSKSFRFGIFTGLGLAVDALFPTGLGTAAGLSISAADTFILDKMIGGWKPNQFVDGVLTEFVRGPA